MWPFSRKPAARPRDDGGGSLGALGEKLALRFLRRRGMKILARNYRCPAGEADLIVLDRPAAREADATIAFVEVKTRRGGQLTDPQSAVDSEKRRRLRKVAGYYLSNHPARGLAARFDVVAIVVSDGQEPKIDYFPDAF